MNKQQYKAYRRNQRICYDRDYDDYGGDKRNRYFRAIPYNPPPIPTGFPNLMEQFHQWKHSTSILDHREAIRDRIKSRIKGEF